MAMLPAGKNASGTLPANGDEAMRLVSLSTKARSTRSGGLQLS